jgi:hypothetical protein
MTGLTRIGFASRGVMYLLIGYLALRTGRTEDGSGALGYLTSGAGKALLVLMALGFLAYALWRLSEALLDSEGHGSDAKGYAVRLGGAVSGLIHLGLGFPGAEARHRERRRRRRRRRRCDAGRRRDGALIPRRGSRFAHRRGRPRADRRLSAGESGEGRFPQPSRSAGGAQGMGPVAGPLRLRGERRGFPGHGLVLPPGGTLFRRRAGRRHGGGLGSLPAALQTAVAAGLFLFGLFSLVEARFRRINDPKVLERFKGAASRAL